jgi:hypothetical protein
MFLSLAYVLFILQTFIILFLILPIPIKVKNALSELVAKLMKYMCMRYMLIILVIIMFGLYIENLIASFKYSDIKEDSVTLPLTMATSVINKNDILLKMYRAQRNMYLTFCINFNWIIMYGLNSFVTKIYKIENNQIAETNSTSVNSINLIPTENKNA